MKHAVIYIPGLGDDSPHGQNIGIQLWRLFGVTPSYLALGWARKEGLDVKLKRLDRLVQKRRAEGYTISLVGVSAGASAALAYYASQPQIRRVIFICGKIHNPDSIHPRRFQANPDFKTSMQHAQPALDTVRHNHLEANILSFYSNNDTTVPPKDSIISGASNKKIWGINHPSVILIGVLCHGRMIANFIKSNS